MDIQEFMAAVEDVLTAIVETGEFRGNYTQPDGEVEALLEEIFTEDEMEEALKEVVADVSSTSQEDVMSTAVRDSEPEGEDTDTEESTALVEIPSSIIESALAAFTAFWTSESSPAQQLYSVVDYYTQYFFSFLLPASSRSGRVIVPVIGVAVTLVVILFALFPILYISAYLLGKFVLAPLVLAPFQSRVKAGRSLDDPDLLNTLSEGVMKALETYNMLQDINSLRSG